MVYNVFVSVKGGVKMDASSYNKYLSQIKFANDIKDKDNAKELLRQIKEALIVQFGFNDSDVEYLLKKFRYDV